MSTKIIIADDHPLFLIGLQTALSQQFNIIGTAKNGKEAVELVTNLSPDVVMLDITMPEMNGIDAALKMRQHNAATKILMLSAETDEQTLIDIVKAGLDGFISKNSSVDEIINAIKTINQGERYYGTDVAQMIHNIRVAQNLKDDTFTDRELDIIRYCAEGHNYREMGNLLNISPRTVETHKNNIFKKLGINSTLDLLRYAIKNGIVRL